MDTVILVVLAAAAILFVCFSVLTVCLFRKVVLREPVSESLEPETADAPMRLSKDWEPYRELFQEGKRAYCLADRETVTMESYDGIMLVGHILRPEGEIKGCLLLMHGFHGSPCHDFGPVLPFYLRQGYLLLLPDERAHGESGGRYITYGIRERFDCRDWAVYLANRFGEEMPIFLDGISMGAATVLMASGLELPSNVRGIIADCGYTSPYAIMRHVLVHRMHLPVFPVLEMAGFLCRVFAGFGLKECSTVEALRENHLPVLLVHGLADHFVPSYMTQENYDACTAPKQVLFVEGAAHGLSYLIEREQCEAYLAQFLKKYGKR